MRQKLVDLQEEIDEFTIVIGDFSVPRLVIDRSQREKIRI